MSKPTILTVDDDPNVSVAITRDLNNKYSGGYRIVRTNSGQEALDVLSRLALRGDPVALILANQRMPGMTGIEMLTQATHHRCPDRRRPMVRSRPRDQDIPGSHRPRPRHRASHRRQRHGGTIAIRSEPGDTVLSVSLPVRRPGSN